jgi:hypothetical protein
MVVENLLQVDNMPYEFRTTGVESHLHVQKTAISKSNQYGKVQELSTPEKAQRFSSQAKRR